MATWGELIPRLTAGELEILTPDPTKRFLSDVDKSVVAAVNGICLDDRFLEGVVTGIPRTDGVEAGIIKIVTDEHGITPDLDRVYRAAARAQAETGVPISTHTNVGFANGRDQQKWFTAHGVDLERTVIGHSGDSTDLDYLKELMDNGSFIGMDRFGMEFVLDDESRVDTLATLLEQGYAEKITISHDAGFFSVNTPPSWRAKHTPNWHHHRISDYVLPELHPRPPRPGRDPGRPHPGHRGLLLRPGCAARRRRGALRVVARRVAAPRAVPAQGGRARRREPPVRGGVRRLSSSTSGGPAQPARRPGSSGRPSACPVSSEAQRA
ncbi:hypothetical protein ACL02T_22850 [Pseudonocardia sp. RS010]|uniref:phosphotriesterase family protein n=1 Tax=Pseudonocardia sp. RS010 TaxID=3385979 RepID=UPI0039A02CCC